LFRLAAADRRELRRRTRSLSCRRPLGRALPHVIPLRDDNDQNKLCWGIDRPVVRADLTPSDHPAVKLAQLWQDKGLAIRDRGISGARPAQELSLVSQQSDSNSSLERLRGALERETSDGLALVRDLGSNPICCVTLDKSVPCLFINWRGLCQQPSVSLHTRKHN
jgi:hypothetical protein